MKKHYKISTPATISVAVEAENEDEARSLGLQQVRNILTVIGGAGFQNYRIGTTGVDARNLEVSE